MRLSVRPSRSPSSGRGLDRDKIYEYMIQSFDMIFRTMYGTFIFKELQAHVLMKALHFSTLCKFTFTQWFWHSRIFLKNFLPVEGKQVITASPVGTLLQSVCVSRSGDVFRFVSLHNRRADSLRLAGTFNCSSCLWWHAFWLSLSVISAV